MSFASTFNIESVVVHKRLVSYDGKEHFFRELTANQAEVIFDTVNERGELDKAKAKGLTARVIAAVVCNEDGSPVGEEAEIGELPAKLKGELMKLSMEVNGAGNTAKKD